MMRCVDIGNYKIKNAINNTLLFKCGYSHISSAFIKEDAPLTDNVDEVKTYDSTFSMLLKPCVYVGPADNDLITGTALTSISNNTDDATIYCKQTAWKQQHSLKRSSSSNGTYVCMYTYVIIL